MIIINDIYYKELEERSSYTPNKEMINVEGDRNTNYSGLIIKHCIHVWNYNTVPHKYVEIIIHELEIYKQNR